ncbi:unnamed protein product [Leptidea sinapis]|uniref:Atos-like conserved domain-containing protein n=1 Tax=Leptidea sinapis TaxID=189913 RepID=A0A5E4PTM9_9NEOP|nr:unnamed protein product [Leptidea sinapis]
MHSSDSSGGAGPVLLQQLGRLIVRSRSTSPSRNTRDRRHSKGTPSTSHQIQSQPKPEFDRPLPGIEAQLTSHVDALWNEKTPICIEVLLAPDCQDCFNSMSRVDNDGSYEKMHHQRGLLLERWTIRAMNNKSQECPPAISSHWLLNAVRSQLHFSQLSAWRARLNVDDKGAERRRKLSRESCNFKKIEANCDETDLEDRKLNIVYSIKDPGESYKMSEFNRTPTDHNFPIADMGDNVYLKVLLQSLPRLDTIPNVKCTCPKRRTSKEISINIHEEIINKLNDLTLGPRKYDNCSKRNIGPDYCDRKILDDRMLTPCNESGKHKCNCDDESDEKKQETKKLDERRLKEIAKYKRRLRKESKLKRLCDSTSSEGDLRKEPHTSIPILQASRFDRFRAIGCYRNQTYLTLPASRIEGRSPFLDAETIPPSEYKRTNTVGTQTDNVVCKCGNPIELKCVSCNKGMVRSEGSYNLVGIEKGARRKREEDHSSQKKLKCDNSDSDIVNKCDDIVRRPKLRRFFPIVDRIEKVISDRFSQNNDIKELNLRDDDTVFSVPKSEPKRQKTYSINEDYVLYEKCDYGTIDKCDIDAPNELMSPDKKEQENVVPTRSEMDRFKWRFDSAASMVFHTKTGLPLTSSPAPLRRGNNCFDFDDSINGVSGIKSALFHPISPPSPAVVSPASPPIASEAHPNAESPLDATHKRKKIPHNKLRVGTSTGLLGSFEESALKGRLEPVATVHGFVAELGASGAFCPPHRRLPVTVFFYAPGGTNAPYCGHINLGPGGYRVSRSGTIQVSLFNPHGTLVKMFVVLYDLTCMPPMARTFLRQRTLYMPAGAKPPQTREMHKWLRYLIHLRFMTSKSGKLYLHTDIRILVSRKADLDTATAHSALFKPIANRSADSAASDRNSQSEENTQIPTNRQPNRVFGGCSDFERDVGFENQNGVSYELRSFTYAPENPKYSPR